MKYTVWLFDGTYHVVDDTRIDGGIETVENAMFNKTPVYLGKDLVAGSAISKIEVFGNKDDYGSPQLQLDGGFEKAAALLESGRNENDNRIEREKEKIRQKLDEMASGRRKWEKEYRAEIAAYKENPEKWREQNGYPSTLTITAVTEPQQGTEPELGLAV